MKKALVLFTMLSLFFISCKEEQKKAVDLEATITEDITDISEPEMMEEMMEEPMDSIAMQQAWEAYMTPGDHHKMMAAETGKWTNEMTFWMGADSQPTKATSTAQIKMILDGRYQETTYKGDMMGMPFEGRSTVAFDNHTKEYIATWIDNMGTGMMVTKGTYDEATKSTTSTGVMVDPVTGKERKIREIYTIIDDNTRKLEMFETLAGKDEYKSMEIVMKRN